MSALEWARRRPTGKVGLHNHESASPTPAAARISLLDGNGQHWSRAGRVGTAWILGETTMALLISPTDEKVATPELMTA
jgi:hypothetical protein